MHYYKRNLGDYAKKAGRLSMLEHGAYTLLLDACYDRERFPTEAEAIEWAWARTEVEIAAVRFVLSRFFALTDGVYVQERIAEEVATYQRNAENNARIAKEREENRKKSARTVHEACDSGNEAPPNHKPLTTNQEPIKDKGARKRSPSFDASAIELPEWLDRQVWGSWCADRKKRGKPITEEAASLQVKKLGEYMQAGHTPEAVIEHSIASSYQGLFAPKTTAQAAPKTGPQAESFRERDERLARERWEQAAGRAPQHAHIIDITPAEPARLLEIEP